MEVSLAVNDLFYPSFMEALKGQMEGNEAALCTKAGVELNEAQILQLINSPISRSRPETISTKLVVRKADLDMRTVALRIKSGLLRCFLVIN